ncbi:MAG TPA: diacylglycerol kinase family protein [Acidimicrobiales bacterium]|nr:diacylglycerol kinase family protein [Acidimicrobiales bacterium]
MHRWIAAAGAVGAGGVWLRRVVLPRRPDDPRPHIPRRIPDPELRPSPDGTGARIVVNPSSGPAWRTSPTEALRDGLPGADVRELGEDDDLLDEVGEDELVTIGAAGGDGTLGAVAIVAADRGVPFVAVPAGTLNHLARDLGIESVDDAIGAVRAGTAIRMDLGVAGDRCFLNTLSFGGYTKVVDARERLESRIGKWPALLVALVRELPGMEPLHVELDGQRMRVWLAWVGNCQYHPAGFGPSWREHLDDGLLDVRIVNGARRFSRTRFVVDVLTGRLSSCPVYEERSVATLRVRSLDGPLRLAADGETFDGPLELDLMKRPRALLVAVPPYEEERPDDSDRPTTTSSHPETPAEPAAAAIKDEGKAASRPRKTTRMPRSSSTPRSWSRRFFGRTRPAMPESSAFSAR